MPTIIPDRMLLVNRKMLIIHTFLRPRDWAHRNSPPGDLASVYQKSDRISKKGLMRAPPRVIIHVFLRVNNAWQGSDLGPERGGAQSSRQAAVVWREQFRGRVMRSKAARPLSAVVERKELRPSSHGGHSRRAAAEYQPGYDGLPEGGCRLPPFTAVRIPGRMARPFEWATRRSRVGTDRFGTGPVGTGCGVPTRLRRVD